MKEEIEYKAEEVVVDKVAKKSAFGPESVINAERMVIDPSQYKWKVFLAGASGSGKTMGMSTLPGRKLLIDLDNRAETVIGVPNLDVYPCHEPEAKSPKAWQKVERVRQVIMSEVAQGIFPYDTVIFDGLTMLGRIALNWALTLDPGRGLGGAPARQHYGPQMDNLAKFVLSTLTLPLNVGYTGHIELFEDETTGAQKFYPKITGKLRSEVANWFNETYYCYRTPDDDGVRRYYWLTGGSGRQEFFKSSLNSLGRYWDDPIEVDFKKEKVGFAELFGKRFKS